MKNDFVYCFKRIKFNEFISVGLETWYKVIKQVDNDIHRMRVHVDGKFIRNSNHLYDVIGNARTKNTLMLFTQNVFSYCYHHIQCLIAVKHHDLVVSCPGDITEKHKIEFDSKTSTMTTSTIFALNVKETLQLVVLIKCTQKINKDVVSIEYDILE